MCFCKQSSLGMGVCFIMKQISSTHLLVCVCNESAPGSARKGAPWDVCVCLCTCKIKGRHGCMCVYLITLPSTATLSYDSTAEWLWVCDYIRQLVYCVLWSSYFVLILFSYSHTTTPCKILNSPHKEYTHKTHSLIAPQAQKADAWYKFYKFAVKK